MQKKSYLNYFIFFLILAITFLILNRLNILNSPISILGEVTSPVRRVFSARLPESELQKRNNELLSKLVDVKKLISENKALSDQFTVTYPKTSDLIPSLVLGSPSFIPGVTIPRTLVLDRGKKDGIKVGDGVISGKNIIGRVSNISDKFSVAMLITNPSVSLTAKTESGASGVVKGMGNEEVILDNVLLSENLKIGDLVFTKGDVNENGEGITPDLVIGQISSVDKKSSDLFQRASLKSFVDFSKLSHVFILRN